MAFRVFFAIAAFYNLDVEQIDVKTAFFHGIIDQLLYIEIPKRYEQPWKDQIYRLKKIFYGLKQSLPLWYERLAKFCFTKLGLHCLHANYSILVTDLDVNGPIITTFVDNLNIFALHESGIICHIKKKLTATFEKVDMRLLAFYIGLKVTRDREKRTIKLS